MGRKNKKYSIDIKQQIYLKLTEMLNRGVGKSKRTAIAKGEDSGMIFSYRTYQTYWKHLKYFANYIALYHPEATTIKAARKYAVEWLQYREGQTDDAGRHLSAWTIQTEAKAINKLYGIVPGDAQYYDPPKRNREDIKRSRGEAKRDVHFSELNNFDFVQFCKATGCRRKILEKLQGRDLIAKENMLAYIERVSQNKRATIEEKMSAHLMAERISMFEDCDYFIHHRTDKGGRERYAPVIGQHIEEIVDRFKNMPPEEKVWKYVPENADVHGYRGEYATAIYLRYARDIQDIPYDKVNAGTGKKYQSDVYVCRKDEKGKKLDKAAMLKASKALGHNRLEIVANNYIRGL